MGPYCSLCSTYLESVVYSVDLNTCLHLQRSEGDSTDRSCKRSRRPYITYPDSPELKQRASHSYSHAVNLAAVDISLFSTSSLPFLLSLDPKESQLSESPQTSPKVSSGRVFHDAFQQPYHTKSDIQPWMEQPQTQIKESGGTFRYDA